jgi:hypothetical protein
MLFPYKNYETLAEPVTVYYPVGEVELARWVWQTIAKASQLLTPLLKQEQPTFKVMVVAPQDWHLAPHDEEEEISTLHPYLTASTDPPSLVVPTEFDPIFGELTPEKLAFMLYHELALAYLEADSRPWPDEAPLWADEWQLKFAALWLSQRLDEQQGMVNKDLREEYAEIFEPEADGKTPDTIRSFEWYEDTTPEYYLGYQLLLEQFASDLLERYPPEILPHFLHAYRTERKELLSDDVTAMLASILGPDGAEWLEDLIYF